MNDAAEAAFSQYLQTALEADANFHLPAPRAVNWYTAGFAGTIKLPWVGCEIIESSTLHPDTRVSKAQLKISIETQADDESESMHIERADKVENALRDWRIVSQTITAAGTIRLFGFSLLNRTREFKDSHWISELLYDVGFGPA